MPRRAEIAAIANGRLWAWDLGNELGRYAGREADSPSSSHLLFLRIDRHWRPVEKAEDGLLFIVDAVTDHER
jgi:hypothetical protein